MNVKHKLELFTKSALDEALRKSDNILQKLDCDYIAECGRIESEAKLAADEEISEEILKIQRDNNIALFSAKTEAKRELLNFRRGLAKKLFDSVCQMLDEYIAKETDYIDSLLRNLRLVASQYNNEEIIFYLTPSDIPKVSPHLGVIDLMDGGAELLGGFKAVLRGRNMIIDNSYSTLLQQEKEAFEGTGFVE